MRVTSISKVAEYRAALASRIREAEIIMNTCKQEGQTSECDTWWGFNRDTRKPYLSQQCLIKLAPREGESYTAIVLTSESGLLDGRTRAC